MRSHGISAWVNACSAIIWNLHPRAFCSSERIGWQRQCQPRAVARIDVPPISVTARNTLMVQSRDRSVFWANRIPYPRWHRASANSIHASLNSWCTTWMPQLTISLYR